MSTRVPLTSSMSTGTTPEELEMMKMLVHRYWRDNIFTFAPQSGYPSHKLSVHSTLLEHGPALVTAEGMRTINASFTPVIGVLRSLLRKIIPKDVEPIGLGSVKAGVGLDHPVHDLPIVVIDDSCSPSMVVLSNEIPSGIYQGMCKHHEANAGHDLSLVVEASAANSAYFNPARSAELRATYDAGYDAGYVVGYKAGNDDGYHFAFAAVVRADALTGVNSEYDVGSSASLPTQSGEESSTASNADFDLQVTEPNAVHDSELQAAHDAGYKAGHDAGYKAGHDSGIYAFVRSARSAGTIVEANNDSTMESPAPASSEDISMEAAAPPPAGSSEDIISSVSGSYSSSDYFRRTLDKKIQRSKRPLDENDALKIACEAADSQQSRRASGPH